MGYARKSNMSRGARTRRPSSRPHRATVVARKTVRVPLATRRAVMKLTRQVRKNTLAKYGAPQVQRQSMRNIAGSGKEFAVSTTRPMCMCLEAIATGNTLYSTEQDGTGLYTVQAYSNWIQQPFPPTVSNAANLKYDLAINRNSKSQGVASTYLYKGTSLDIQLFASAVNGWFHMYKITPKASVTRITDQERRLPYCLPSFVHMGGGCDQQYDQSSQFFSIKRVWSKYFNVLVGGGVNNLVQTNNLAYKRIWLPGTKLISGTDIAGINLVTDEDIPTRKQSWLVFQFTDNNPPTQGANLRVQLQRTVHWRDPVGSK